MIAYVYSFICSRRPACEVYPHLFLFSRLHVLNKRHNSNCYHRVREAQDAGVICDGWIPGEFNQTYLFTKTTIPVNTRINFVDSIFSNAASQIGRIDKA